MKLSIIIPTYNRAHLIKNSILNILEQTYQNTHVIVVDDCSSDNTQEVVKSINNTRVQYFRNKKNIGVDNTQYHIIKQINTDFFTIVADDDQFIDNTFFQKAMDLAISDKSIDIISGKTEVVFNGAKIKNSLAHGGIYSSYEVLSNIDLFRQFTYGGTCFFKKKLVTKDINKKEHDYATSFKLIYRANKIALIDQVSFRWNTSTEGNSFGARMARNHFKHLEWDYNLIQEIYFFLEKYNDLDRFMDIINSHMFFYF